MFMDILTFLGLDYRDATLILLYFVFLGISIQKIRYRIILSDTNFVVKKVEN